MAEHFDVIVVGAGMAGNAAAYTLAKAGLNVLQIERGEYPGSKNVQGAILYASAVEALIPDFRDEAPLERHVIEQRMWILDDRSYVGTHFRSENFNEERPNRYTIIRAQFDKWLNRKAKDAGAMVICETTVLELIKDDAGKVIGVRCDRENGEVYADVVVLCDGVNAMVGQRSGIRAEIAQEHAALAVKEMHFLPREVINERFNISDNEGVVIEILGTVTSGMLGTGFLYTNGESIALGIGCIVSDFIEKKINPAQLLEKLKTHPSVAPLIKGSEVKEYAAHLIPEGGFKGVPELSGAGWVICGDAAHFVNAAHREGSNLALTSGRIAAESIIALKKEGKEMSAENLKLYNQSLEESFVLKDLKKYKDLPDTLWRNKQFVTTYPELLAKAAEQFLRVDGVDKLTKEKEIARSFRKARGVLGLVGDAVKVARAWR
ncbi:FAD-dependent oxidoreductase [Pararhodospirillum photometricum]|uniref:Protein FixC n=1 Tax=Pararhodospirillum photometricum DSM 122 TaxID=1150469 RepID=H6SS65_PARPM|nr:FAD-dependent oxidoreductase [Pararhodospirillum photometricum]CCG07744.1 FixC [Pararhodospirillum photometricum DSM 122]